MSSGFIISNQTLIWVEVVSIKLLYYLRLDRIGFIIYPKLN